MFGHVERMDEYRMSRRVLMTDVSGGLVRSRLMLGSMEGGMVAFCSGGMTVVVV